MPKKLIPLTDEIKESSLLNVKTWDAPSERNSEDNIETVKDIVSKINLQSKSSLNIFATKSTTKVQEKGAIQKCKKNAVQKKIADEAEKNYLSRCLDEKIFPDEKLANRIEYNNDKNISIETLKASDEKNKPQSASNSPSLVLSNVPTRKMLNLLKPKFSIKTKEETESSKSCQKSNFDPREAQKNLTGKLKIYQCGEKLFVRSDQTNDQNVANSGREIAICRPHIHIDNPNFAILTLKQKKLPKFDDLSLGDPYGIQLGLRNLRNKKTVDLKDLHASDVLIVAHAMACMKHPANWNEKDIDLILTMGAELYRNTKNSHIDRSNKFTKGFSYREKFIQVTCSEPIVVGKIMTESDRSMDLYNGLHKFFASYRHALITIPRFELYVMMEGNALFVFDPRGRNEKCERDHSREAALMAFASIDNLYHLIMNLSYQNVHNLFFKICELKITRMSKKINETEEFSAKIGNPNVKCRNSDYKTLNEHVILLRGSVHLNSNIFRDLKNRHGLLSSVMAMVYSKIDPPASWNQSIFDRVMHFGYKLHMECLEGLATIRNLSISEVPSKFYVGDSYLTQICIVPYIQRCNVVKTRILLDNPMVEAIMSAFESFKFLILELDNFYFALWKTEDEKKFYFFDGYQKTLEGYVDLYLGFASLFISNIIDSIIEIVVNRMIRTSESSLKIHGLKVLTLQKLSNQEMKSKKIFKLAKMDCIRPFTADDAENLTEAPSTVDSVAPLFTKSDFKILNEKSPEKPKHLQMTDLNSPSLVACKKLAYHEIMTTIEKKLSTINVPQVRDETMELMHEVQSEILGKIFGKNEKTLKNCEEGKTKENVKALIKDPKTNRWCPCGEFTGTAEKVLMQTDLDCLNEEREKLLTSTEIDDEDEKHKCCRLLSENAEKFEFLHFQRLLDGTRIVSGTKNLFNLPLDPKIYDYNNFSILIAVAAIVTSTRYKISTWSPETVDYVLGCGNIMSNVIELKNRMDFYTHDEHILPKIHLNQKFYNLGLKSIVSGPFKSLEACLKKLFVGLDRFLIVTNRGSVAIFKRNGIFYLFEYATCNRVGYRIKDKDFGFSCMLSFTDLHSLVRRIYANHCDVQESDKFIVYRVILSELSDKSPDKAKFVSFTPSKENLVIENLRHHHKMKRAEILKKLNENDAKVLEEKERIKNYRNETGQSVPENLTEDDLKHEKFDESKLDEAFELELNADTLDNQIQPIYQSWCSLDELGFKKDENDIEPKIKGSFGYENRMTIEENSFKKCHFTSVYAILYAVHNPFDSMNYRSIDVILENGTKLFESVDLKEYSREMNLKNVIVDKRCYELLMCEFQNMFNKSPKNVFDNFFLHQKYGILQGKNCCMAVVKNKSSKSFQLFDPYNPTDIEIGVENKNPIASWTNFSDIDSLIEYIKDKFVVEEENVQPFKLYQMGILSSKVLKAQKTGYFIFNPQKASEAISCEYSDESADEKIEWIIDTQTIPWSRLEKTGVADKWKEYEIEIERKLFSLWGNIHPNMKYFKEQAGKQHLACCIVSLVTSQLFYIDEWSSQMLDNIVVSGTNFLKDVINDKGVTRNELSIDDFNSVCKIDNFSYKVNLQLEIFGQIYEDDRSQFNLCRALEYAFNEKKFNGVILLCAGQILSIGNHQNKTFFMYDCQSHGTPLFKPFQGTTYVLKCCCMKVLLACIVLTLNIKRHGVKFHLYSVHGQEAKAKKAVVIDDKK